MAHKALGKLEDIGALLRVGEISLLELNFLASLIPPFEFEVEVHELGLDSRAAIRLAPGDHNSSRLRKHSAPSDFSAEPARAAGDENALTFETRCAHGERRRRFGPAIAALTLRVGHRRDVVDQV